MLVSKVFERGTSIFLVHWVRTFAAQRGKRVRLDDRGRIIYNVPAATITEDLADTEILVHDILAQILKTTFAHRETVPEWVFLLWELAEARVFCGPCDYTGFRPHRAPCVVCAFLALHGPAEAFTCQHCTLRWHHTCAERVAKWLDMVYLIDCEAFRCPMCARAGEAGFAE